MKMTTDTLRNMTEADALAPVNAARARLAEAATTSVEATALDALVHIVAAAEATARIRFHVALMLRADDNEESIRELLMNQLLAGADDTWSGRSNDLRRAMHDGRIAAVREILDALDRAARKH